MRKNIIILALILVVPFVAYLFMSKSADTSVTATAATGKPQVIKFTSAMCLDCQKMNKIMKEIYPKYQDKVVLVEVPVQDGSSFANEQIKKYNVTLVPTFVMLNSDGKQVRRIEGAIPQAELEKYLQELK